LLTPLNSDIDWGLFYANENHDDCDDRVKGIYGVFKDLGFDIVEPVFHFNVSLKDQIELIFPFLNFDTMHSLEKDPTNSFQRSASTKRDLATEIILAYALKPLEDLALNPNGQTNDSSANYHKITIDRHGSRVVSKH
jgi:hypothetical protein